MDRSYMKRAFSPRIFAVWAGDIWGAAAELLEDLKVLEEGDLYFLARDACSVGRIRRSNESPHRRPESLSAGL